VGEVLLEDCCGSHAPRLTAAGSSSADLNMKRRRGLGNASYVSPKLKCCFFLSIALTDRLKNDKVEMPAACEVQLFTVLNIYH
jgi:hypothetical protein